MSLTGKYTPLGLNSLGSLVQNQGLCINPEAVRHMGSSTSLSNYTLGITTQDTVLRMLVWSIRAGFLNTSFTNYSQLISIGANSIPLLGDSKPLEYKRTATLNPYPNAVPYTSEYTSFGWLRIIPLQAHYEFYINNGSYSDFVSTFSMSSGFINVSNKAIDAFNASPEYLDGAYSNMNDLITADISGVNLALFDFGQELINSGRAIDLSSIDTFGQPLNLLKTLYKNRGITKSVNLALISAGFSSDDIDILVKSNTAPADQQKKIFAAFSIIMGKDLEEVLLILNCQIKNVPVLSYLLSPKILFPKSHASLTVPVYNASPGPTNSKTYLLIYDTDGSVRSQVTQRFGVELSSILPFDLSAACEAFSIAMMQIKNIKAMNIEKFSQVVNGLEAVSDLNVNGTNIPTDKGILTSTTPLLALGSGLQGRYTTCDFFGAMSGITYDWKNLTGYIKSLQTQKLFQIYHELYLAITWKASAGTVQITTSYEQTASEVIDPDTSQTISPAYYRLKYSITGITLTDPGGGYSRGNAPAPLVSFYEPSAIGSPSGATATTSINTSDTSSPTGPPATFGKIISLSLTSAGQPVIYATGVPAANGKSGPPTMSSPTIPELRIQRAPTDTLPVYTNNGTNTPYNTVGWPGMNSVGLAYINQANSEIQSISTNNPTVAVKANTLYNIFGWHMTLEQNARSLGLRQEKYLPDLSTTVVDIYAFMEGLNQFSLDTGVEMSVQVLEAITDYSKIGGRSLVGMMRETRNAHRLGLTGAEQDNEVGIEKLTLPRVNGSIPTKTVIDNFTGEKTVVTIGKDTPLVDKIVVTGGPTDDPTIVGSLSTSPEVTLIPDDLNPYDIADTVKSSIITIDHAIEDVILCNCDCWDNLP